MNSTELTVETERLIDFTIESVSLVLPCQLSEIDKVRMRLELWHLVKGHANLVYRMMIENKATD